jgi:hypothetical protein
MTLDRSFTECLDWVKRLEQTNRSGANFSHVARNLLQIVCDVQGKERQKVYEIFDLYRELVETNPDFRTGEFKDEGYFSEIPKHGGDGGSPEHYVQESVRRLGLSE